MKNTKLFSSIILTTLLASGSIFAWTNISTVSDNTPLTSSLWNNLVSKINENGNAIATLSGSVNTSNSMINGWPDAITCTKDATNKVIAYLTYVPPSGDILYAAPDFAWGSNHGSLDLRFQQSGAFSSTRSGWGTIITTDCQGKSITQLYSEWKAFNFVKN